MRPGPALLLLGLGLGLGLLPPHPAPRGARAAVPGAPATQSGGLLRGARGLRERGGRTRLSLRRRAARDGGVLLSGSRDLCFPRGGPGRAGAERRVSPRPPGWYCLGVRVLLRGRPGPAAPTHVDLRVSAPRGRLSLAWSARLPHSLGPLAWAFRLRLLGPGEARPTRARRAAAATRPSALSVLPADPRPYSGFVAHTQCPTDGPTPVVLEAVDSSNRTAMTSSVSCQIRSCIIKQVKINTNNDSAPVFLTRKEEATINATAQYDCPFAQAIATYWQVFSVPSVNDVPDWTQPMDLSQIEIKNDPLFIHIPRSSLHWGVYVFNFTVSITTSDPRMPLVQDSDSIYVCIVRRPLKAVILGNASMTVNFTDELILNGAMSSDPEADDPLEGLQFFWHCTTNPHNYREDQIMVMNQEVCHPEQTNLKWPWASGPVLTLLPETLKGAQVYFFRMVIQKGFRRAFSDKRVHVLQGPRAIAHISCIENCDRTLIISDRFSLFLNCTNCARRDFYKWSILSSLGSEVLFDWMGQTVTGRNSAYLSIKAFAFSHFSEAEFSASLYVASWSGDISVFRHFFIPNHGPQLGECKINPAKGIALFTKFVVQCSNFKDQHIPLTYKIIVSDLHGIGEISSVKENSLGAILYLGTEPTAPPSFLPVGVLTNHYATKIYAQVYDSLGAFAQVTLYATVQAPTDKNSSKTVLHQLLDLTNGPSSLLSTLLQKQNFLSAGYLMYIVASVLNNMKAELPLRAEKVNLREHLVNQSFLLPASTLVEIGQVVTTITKLTQKPLELTGVAQKRATVRIWQANQALQEYQQKDKHFSSEQIEIVSTGILTSLSNILKLTVPHEVVEDPFYVIESLSDTILANKVPGTETTVMRTPNFNMYVKKVEKWKVTQVFRNETRCRNCFYPALNVSSVPALPANAPVSTMFCEFAEDPFPWLDGGESASVEVVGFRMTGAADNGTVIEITPDVVEVYLVRKNLTFAAFNLTVGPSSELDGALKKTTGVFSFEVDSRVLREVLVHIVTEVTVLFEVLVYAGSQLSPTALVATFLVPHDIPPVASQSALFDPACTVKAARLVCLPLSLLQVIAQRSHSSQCAISVVLRAPRFVIKPNDRLVRISLFSVQCLDMYGIQSEWREDNCVLGEKTTWHKVHCVCRHAVRARRQLGTLRLTSLHLHTCYVMARVIVVPNPVDLQLKVIKNVYHNPVTLFTVLFIMFLYMVLAFWALHRDEMDQFLREHVIVLPDNDPYDNICYLVTVFTGSRCGAGTRADVFVQLRGTASTSDVHCLSHPHFTTLYRGSISTFLLTTKSDLGDIHSIRVWHNNEGKAPSWYLSRIKVENLFSRHVWLFICRKWLSVDTTLDRTFHVTHPDQPLNRRDFFFIDVSNKLGKNHMWFSIFASVVPKPFSRLQRLSCCLAMLLSSLLCNIMFFNLNRKEQTQSREGRYIRSMMIGIESVLITIPVQLLITFLFTYSQKKPQVKLEEVSPQEHPLMSEDGGHWEERLGKWHARQTAVTHASETAKTVKPASRRKPGIPKPSVKATFRSKHQHEKAETKAPETHRPNTNSNNNNNNREDNEDVPSEEPSSQQDLAPPKKKPRIVLPWWCVYAAWFLVFAASSISSFFIVFYGLTYGYERSVEWLFACFCSFCQSVFLVQPSKIILWSGIRTNKPKYCKNLSWSTRYHYSEIRLRRMNMHPEEMRRLHDRISQIRGTRMYQPLTEDEVRIFKRKKRIKRRALLFLSYLATHLIFLALLLVLIGLLRHTDSFYYNQFLRDQFSMDLAAVTKLEDVYRWLNSVLLPLLHNDLNPTFLLDGSSTILGLPLMRQVRAKSTEKPCLPAENFVQNSIKREIRCHPKYGIDPEDTKDYSSFWNEIDKRHTHKNTNGFAYKHQGKQWVYYSYGSLHTYGSGGYAFYFFPKQQKFNSTLRLRELQESNWLDEKTWAVILELTTFNPDVSLFCSISVVFEVSQLGVVNTSIALYSFSLAEFNRKASAEIYLYVAILIFFLAYTVDEGYIIMQERASYVRSVYNLLNFALKCIFTVLIVLFLRKHFLATGMIRFYLSNPEDFIPFHAVSRVDHTMRIILGFLLFLTILKTLRYSRFFYDVRLAQKAIQAALPGICHMAFVVSVYFFVYMAFGYLVFGQHEWNYSNLIHATQTIFSYCVSAFQNTEFSHNRILGVLFLSSFMLVMICILINLFQAVILSAYEEMKQPVYEEPSDEVEAMTYLCGKLRTIFGFQTSQSRAKDEPEFFVDMLYGQPEKNNHRYLGLKTRNINGKKMVYLVV
ncbi:PREDICTED: polycystic kidney disease and receptor for egg jelly-related protein [Propithecus coquereli]|uniref:polycystic kidney disease and receptor for egg jelly-related protein n=1 Tax=Propithecus coquereli TaxID=379532 RepID=UPI00063EDB90|nr:PREDICTED: polycystic kidney disease and receptor for egg jelly-related protein [Propithecus coquereli]